MRRNRYRCRAQQSPQSDALEVAALPPTRDALIIRNHSTDIARERGKDTVMSAIPTVPANSPTPTVTTGHRPADSTKTDHEVNAPTAPALRIPSPFARKCQELSPAVRASHARFSGQDNAIAAV